MRHLYFPILAGGCMFVSALHAQNERPNIVFIMADDLGWNDLGITGSDYYETPNIDKLASEGISNPSARRLILRSMRRIWCS